MAECPLSGAHGGAQAEAEVGRSVAAAEVGVGDQVGVGARVVGVGGEGEGGVQLSPAAAVHRQPHVPRQLRVPEPQPAGRGDDDAGVLSDGHGVVDVGTAEDRPDGAHIERIALQGAHLEHVANAVGEGSELALDLVRHAGGESQRRSTGRGPGRRRAR